MFYPGRADDLSAQVNALLDEARRGAPGPPPQDVKALVAPHAGYIYSGLTAAIAYARLGRTYERVILAGPCHRVGTSKVALPGADYFATPLGQVPIWRQGADLLAAMPEVIVSPEVHADEHSLEVQLPFIQTVLGADVPVLPLAVGWSAPTAVAAVLEAVWGDPASLVVVSSDLSHYLPYSTAQAVDRGTLGQVTALAPDVEPDQACGVYPLNGLSVAAGRHGLVPEVLDYRNSGDTAGDRQAVVGYAAIAYRQEMPDAA
jgi:AmmeMemoRadiSam system protein B